MLRHVSQTAPLRLRFNVIDLIGHSIKGANAVGKEILMAVEKEGVVEKFIDGNETSWVRHHRAVAPPPE